MENIDVEPKVIVVGAGPAGLAAARTLVRGGVSTLVVEADPEYVGGLSKTVRYKGYRFDIGGHRFYTKIPEVQSFWNEVLGSDLLKRQRKSRIYYNKKFFSYPLKSFDVLLKISPIVSLGFVISYLKSKVCKRRKIKNLEEWFVDKFGAALYKAFFKSYTEKVWGKKCIEMEADWADQRIKGLSFFSAVKDALLPSFISNRNKVKSLISSFLYPKYGPGMMWEACAREVQGHGGKILMGCRVGKIQYNSAQGMWHIEAIRGDSTQEIRSQYLISTIPLNGLIQQLRPKLSQHFLDLASKMEFRDFLTVAVILNKRIPMQDNWIYVHDEKVLVGRIQIYRNWSPHMLPSDDSGDCLGLEYFCHRDDKLWKMTDDDLSAFAHTELKALGILSNTCEIIDYKVVRVLNAYPVYYPDYKEDVEKIKKELDSRFQGLFTVGRGGMYRYNNQDHSIKAALAVANEIVEDRLTSNYWKDGESSEYLEQM